MELLEIARKPWPWYLCGFLLGITIPLLLFQGNKRLSISSNLRHLCAAFFSGGTIFFRYDWKSQLWNLYFAAGILIGGLFAGLWLTSANPVNISDETFVILNAMGVHDFNEMLPTEVFRWSSLTTLRGFIFIVIGGFLVGFGTRYAGGCISSHGLMGLSNLEWPSLVAIIFLMTGGILTTHFLLPLLLNIK